MEGVIRSILLRNQSCYSKKMTTRLNNVMVIVTLTRAATVERQKQSLTEACSKDNGNKKNVIGSIGNFCKNLDCKVSREK